MKPPPIPENEPERLAELYATNILDTLPEATYDAITLLASEICDAPVALISIIDRDRQWFKSTVGFRAKESPRDLAFCAHAIVEPEHMLVIPDATVDGRFSDHPLVANDPSIRFYAGAPLVTSAGNALGTLCVLDRTPRTLTDRQEEALQALSRQVMALLELRSTVDRLHEKQEELERVMEERETFLATVSHEIRTPLSAVVGYIDVLTDVGLELSDEERSEMLATVGRQAGDVAHLIEDLLAAAKAEANTLRVQSVAVNVAAQTAQVLEGLDPDRVATVSVESDDTRASGDPARVRQVIRNLLTNAFRYGGPNVSVRIGAVGRRCLIEVFDDGQGVPEEDRVTIFETFGQSDNGDAVSGSIGLGLPISRMLAERMGGSLDYAWREGRSVFTFELATTR